MKKIKLCFELFFTFLKIGLFTFGGGYAMIAILENEFVQRKKWIDHDEFMNIVAIAESTPGPIAINSATFIGYKLCGVCGSALSTIGVCVPSFVIIYIISLFFDKFMSFKVVSAAFKGIQVCVIWLIFSAGLKMFKKMEKNIMSVVLLCLSIIFLITLSLFAVSFSTIYYILIGGVVGLFVYLIKKISLGGDKK